MTDYDDILHDALEQITPACFNSSMRPLCWQLYILCYYHPRTNELPIFQIYRFSARSLISRLNLSANLEKEWQSCLCTCVYLYVGTVYRASVFYLVPAILLLPLVTRMNEEIKAGTSDALKHEACQSVASKYFWSEETINYHNSSRQALSLELEPPCLCD